MNNVDEFIKQNINREYAVDPNLYASLQDQLNTRKPSNTLWFFNLNSILLAIVLTLCAFIHTDTVKNNSTENSNLSFNGNSTNSDEASSILSQNSNSSAEKTSQTSPEEKLLAKPSIKKSSDKVIESKKETTIPSINKTTEETQPVALTTEPSIELKNTETVKVEQSKINNVAQQNSVVKRKSVDSSPELTSTSTIENDLFLMQIEPKPYHLERLHSNHTPKNDTYSANRFQQLFKKRPFYYEAEIQQSVSLSKKITADDKKLEEYKLNKEQSDQMVSIGLNALKDYQLITLGIGLTFNRYYENFNYEFNREQESSFITYDTSYSIVNGSYNSNGNSVLLIQQNVREIENPTTKVVKEELLFRNEFTRLRIPFSIGLRKNIGRWNGQLRTAVALNYLITKEGIIISEDLNQIEDLHSTNQLNEFSLSHLSSASVGYSINEFIVIGGRYSYDQDLTSTTKPFNSRYTANNIGVWIQWKP